MDAQRRQFLRGCSAGALGAKQNRGLREDILLPPLSGPRPIGAGFSGLDLFHAPGLFAREWPKLRRTHALEAPSKLLPPERKAHSVATPASATSSTSAQSTPRFLSDRH